MRAHSDESIQALAAQPDMPYMAAFHVMEIAVNHGYTYDDYEFFARTINRFVYSRPYFQRVHESLHVMVAT